MNELSKHALLQMDSLDNFSLGKAVRDFRSRADDLNIDITKVQYTPIDSTMYLPNGLAEGGARAFNKEVKDPPSFRVKDY